MAVRLNGTTSGMGVHRVDLVPGEEVVSIH
jgi:hypothetical protein